MRGEEQAKLKRLSDKRIHRRDPVQEPGHCAEYAEKIFEIKCRNRLGLGDMDVNRVTEAVIGAAIEVHKALGLGLLESA